MKAWKISAIYKFSFEDFKGGFSHGVVVGTAFETKRPLDLKGSNHVENPGISENFV